MGLFTSPSNFMFGQFLKGEDHSGVVQTGVSLGGDTVEELLRGGGVGVTVCTG